MLCVPDRADSKRSVFVRFDLILRGRTSGGLRCEAIVSVHASSQAALRDEAHRAAEHGPWHLADDPTTAIAESESITVERVELLRPPDSGATR